LISRHWPRSDEPLHSCSRSITISNRLWLKSTYGESLQLVASFMISGKRRMDCSSTMKSSDTIATLCSSVSTIHPSRVCRPHGLHHAFWHLAAW
jgi:hypothetical protein